jgi:hypothetical protein
MLAKPLQYSPQRQSGRRRKTRREREKPVEKDFHLVSVSVRGTEAAASASEDWQAKWPIVTGARGVPVIGAGASKILKK